MWRWLGVRTVRLALRFNRSRPDVLLQRELPELRYLPMNASGRASLPSLDPRLWLASSVLASFAVIACGGHETSAGDGGKDGPHDAQGTDAGAEAHAAWVKTCELITACNLLPVPIFPGHHPPYPEMSACVASQFEGSGSNSMLPPPGT